MTDDNSRRDDTVKEEVSAFGERVKGAAKDAAGSITGNRGLEREGERENASGRARQAQNDVMDQTDGVAGHTITGRSTIEDMTGSGSTYHEELSAPTPHVKDTTRYADGSMLGLNRTEREGQSSTSSSRLVTGMYDSPEHAGRAYNDLTTKHGYKADDVSVLMSDDTRHRHFGDAKPGTEFTSGSKAAEGAGLGGATGLSVGAVLGGLLAAATSIAIPGIGLIVAGPLAGAIAGAGAGGAAGTLIGAMIGAGIPEERAKVYDEGIRSGGIVLGTRARDEQHAAELERDFATYGGRDVLR